MKIHKEGKQIITITAALTLILVATLIQVLPVLWFIAAAVVIIVILTLIIRFFRVPRKDYHSDDNAIFSAADGTVVAIEKVTEDEYFHEPRLLVSVFMSIYNVHINWFPISGDVVYQKYHPGKFLVAWHPKSSTDNERTTVVVRQSAERTVLFRQIAGAVARRIVCYPKQNDKAIQNQECGFIKFGSRVDHFLPADAKVEVSLNQKVVGAQTIIATFAK